MEPTQVSRLAPAASVPRVTQAVSGTPVVHVVQPDVYLVQKSNDNFWNTQATPLAAILGVVLTIVAKWVWDVRAEKKELKRKLYLELADAITEGSAVLGAFTEPNMPIETLKDRFVKSVSVVAKTEVVATGKLLAALADLSDVGGRAFMELLRARMPLEKCRADINTNDPFIKTYDVDIDAVLSEQKRMRINNINDPDRFLRLQQQYEFARDRRAELVEKSKRAAEGVNAAIANISDVVLTKQIELLPYTERVKQLTRNDLGFKYDYDGNLKRKLLTAQKVQEEFRKTQKVVAETFTPDSKKKAGDEAHD